MIYALPTILFIVFINIIGVDYLTFLNYYLFIAKFILNNKNKVNIQLF